MMLSITTLALCVLQLQIVYGDTPVSTIPFGLVDQKVQVAYNNTLVDPPGLTLPLDSET